MVKTLHVDLGEKSYPILIGSDLLPKIGELISEKIGKSKIVLVADRFVFEHYGHKVLSSLSSEGLEVDHFTIPPGEENKSLEWFAKIHDFLLTKKFDRETLLIAFGGGVVGDLAGFVAATYMRGISWVQVPTTLLAQVDASIGGKTAVNRPKGKNMVGAFHQPKLVAIDVEVLRTLPLRDIRSGLVEVIKHGIIMDEKLFAFIEENLEAILELNSAVMVEAISRSCAAKASVVASDETEKGLRAILNYGHTFAHAIETLTNYNTLRHGEAVAIGMNLAGNLAVNLGIFARSDLHRQNRLLQAAGLPIELPSEINSEELLRAIYHDKKVLRGNLRFILPTAIGKVEIRNDLSEREIISLF